MPRPSRALLLLVALASVAIVAMLGPVPAALAHTELARWEVQGGSADTPRRLLLRFTEPIDGRFLTVDILGANGTTPGPVTVDPQHRTDGFVDISALAPGTYSVAWWTRAVDGDPSNGSFLMGLGTAVDPASLLPPVGARDPATQPAMFYGDTAWNTIIHWLIYLGAALLIGGLGFGLLVWRPAILKEGDNASGAARLDTHLPQTLRLVAIAGGSLFLFANLMLFVMQVELIRYAILQPVTAVAPTPLAPSALSHEAPYRSAADIFQGYNGAVWIARMVLGTLVLVLTFRLTVSPTKRPRRWIAALAAALVTALTVSLTAHAAVVPQSPFAVVLDWTHLAAMSLWLGGLLPLLLALREFRRAEGAGPADGGSGADGTELRRAVVRRFSTIALLAVIWLAVTGLFGAYLHVGDPSLLVPTTYGRALIAKLVLFAALFALGAVHRRVSIPRLGRDSERDGTEESDGPGRSGAGPQRGSGAGPSHKSTLERLLPVEIAVGVSLLMAVALMMSLATTASAWSAHEALGLTSHASMDQVTVTFRAAPGRAGENAVALDIADRRSGPPTVAERVTLDIAGQVLELTPVGKLVAGSIQRFVCGELVNLPEGKTTMTYTVIRPSYPDASGTITVDVPPAPAPGG